MASKIGEKVEKLRSAAGMSREELATAAAIGNEMVEKVETTDQIPPVSLVTRICNALGVRTGTVLDGSESAGPVMDEQKKRAPKAEFAESNLRYYMLAQRKCDRNMEPKIIEVEYAEDIPSRSNHEGEEFLYVLEGEVVLHYGDENYTLSGGDSIYYDSVVPHLLSAIREGVKAKVLAITYMPSY